MRTTDTEINVHFSSKERDLLRLCYEHSDVEKPFNRVPGDTTPEEIEQLREVIGDALHQGDFDQSIRLVILKLRKQLREVVEGCEKAQHNTDNPYQQQ